jgi:hypothetical protein
MANLISEPEDLGSSYHIAIAMWASRSDSSATRVRLAKDIHLALVGTLQCDFQDLSTHYCGSELFVVLETC